MQKCRKTLSYQKKSRDDKQKRLLFVYYDENYLPPKRKWAKRDLFAYQPNSGTALAYKYAKQKNKILMNFANTIDN